MSKAFCFDVSDDIVDKYNNTYHRTIEVKTIDFKSGFDAEYNVDSDGKVANFTVDDHV